MKRNYPNQLKISFKNLRAFTGIKFVIIAMLLNFTSSVSTAQTSRRDLTASKIDQFDKFIAALSKNDVKSAARLRSLTHDVQPSVYITDNKAASYGDSPVCVFTDVRSASSLSGFPKDNIEIITVRITNAAELNGSLDLSSYAAFPKLKYVYVLSDINTSEEIIAKMIKNKDPQSNVLFKIALPF